MSKVQCKECGKYFQNKKGLANHYRHNHESFTDNAMDIKDTSGGKRNVDDLYNFCNISTVPNDSNLFASTFETEIVFESNSNIEEDFET